PGGIVAAQCSVLEQPPALGAVQRGAPDVVEDAEGDPGDDGRVCQVVGRALDPAGTAPLSVAPVGVAAVAGADVEGDVAERRHLEGQGLAAPLGQVQRGPLGDAGAGRVDDLDLGPAQLLDATVG